MTFHPNANVLFLGGILQIDEYIWISKCDGGRATVWRAPHKKNGRISESPTGKMSSLNYGTKKKKKTLGPFQNSKEEVPGKRAPLY